MKARKVMLSILGSVLLVCAIGGCSMAGTIPTGGNLQPTSAAVPTAAPTEVPASTNTPMPTLTVEPTPTNTPIPTSAPTSTSTPVPTSTPTSTNTPIPTSVPTSTSTPIPTYTPTPTNTPTPTSTPTPVPHVHNYEEVIVTDATCETEGSKVFSCSCGHSYEETIPALGHTFTSYVYNDDATYLADGTETSVCERCSVTNTRTSENSKKEYTYTELSKTMWAKNSVNVRTLPSTDGEKIGSLSSWEEVKVTGQCKETGWYRIEYNGEIGYASSKYFSESPKPTATPAPSPAPKPTATPTPTSGQGGVWDGVVEALKRTPTPTFSLEEFKEDFRPVEVDYMEECEVTYGDNNFIGYQDFSFDKQFTLNNRDANATSWRKTYSLGYRLAAVSYEENEHIYELLLLNNDKENSVGFSAVVGIYNIETMECVYVDIAQAKRVKSIKFSNGDVLTINYNSVYSNKTSVAIIEELDLDCYMYSQFVFTFLQSEKPDISKYRFFMTGYDNSEEGRQAYLKRRPDLEEYGGLQFSIRVCSGLKGNLGELIQKGLFEGYDIYTFEIPQY